MIRRLVLLGLFVPVAALAQPVSATRHMVATANPLASAAAQSILRAGGSAVDAAIAGQMVLAVVEPQSSGLGGGSLLMVWDAQGKTLSFTEGLASAPAQVPADWTHDEAGQAIPNAELERSGRVVGVPGTLRTMAMVHEKYGKLPWERLFRDAIQIAAEGFALPPYLHAVLLQRPELARVPAIAALYFADGKPLPAGTMVRNVALAATLQRIATSGADAFYTGPFAADIVTAVDAGTLPGAMTSADLAAYRPKQREPVCAVAFAHRICSAAPPVSGGIALLQLLVMADRLGIAETTPGSAEAAHLFLEAARLSEADRRAYPGDPDQVRVPVEGLLDPRYLADRAALVAKDHAMTRVSAGQPPGRQGSLAPSDPLAQPATTHLSIVDDAGNAVSFTTTINQNFGSDIMVDGLVLNDALTNFAVRSELDGVRVPNAMAPGKRPITTMAPTIVFGADGRPEMVVGAGGGARIIDSVAETIIGVLAWHLDVRRAIEQPRIGGENRAQELERGTAAAELAPALTAMGHDIRVVAMNAGVQAVVVTPGGLLGWADPRRDGVALGD